MRPLAHHLGEETLAPLLLLGSGGGLSLLLAIGRARLTAIRARLTSKQGSRRRG
jgi:hypothetical protein